MRQSNVLRVQDLERPMEFHGVICVRSTSLSCGMCFQAFVYVTLHVACAYLKPLYLAQNWETVKQCTSVLLFYLMLFNVMISRIESSSLRVVFSIKKAVSFPLPPEVCS